MKFSTLFSVRILAVLLWRYSHIFLKIFRCTINSVLENNSKMKTKMLKNIAEVKKEKERVFQVLFLDNDGSQVQVQEAERVDFLRVQKHLKHGGSVFITSKSSQKLTVPKEKRKHPNTKEPRWVTASYFNHV